MAESSETPRSIVGTVRGEISRALELDRHAESERASDPEKTPPPEGPVTLKSPRVPMGDNLHVRPIDTIRAIARDAFALIRRQARLFGMVFVGTALVLGLAIALQTPKFESTALLLVKVGREQIYTPEVGDQKAVSSRDKATVINSELAIVRSEPVVTGVIDAVGLARLYPDLAETLNEVPTDSPERAAQEAMLASVATERFRQDLVVVALPDADVIQVSYRHPEAHVAQAAVNAVLDEFTDAHLNAFGEPEVVRFLEQQVITYRNGLEAAEEEVRKFEVAHPVFALEAPQAMLAQRMEELRGQIEAIDSQINAARMSVVRENSAVAEAQRERLALEMEASRFKGHLREDADRRLDVVKQFISSRKAEVDQQVGRLQARRGALEAELDGYEAERVKLPELSAAHRQLVRERDAHEEQYATYEKRLRDAQLSHEMDAERIASLSVIQQATLAPAPIWPLPPKLGIPVVLVLALLVAGLAVTLVDTYGWMPGRRRLAGDGGFRKLAALAGR
jgi:uncharacterized protein involved in exopolysaccharide biosynthesis